MVSVERRIYGESRYLRKSLRTCALCGAGVIDVGGEGKYLDAGGIEHTKLNDNVLIEIGAAMALYGEKGDSAR